MKFEEVLGALVDVPQVEVPAASTELLVQLEEAGLEVAGNTVQVPQDIMLLGATSIRSALAETTNQWISDLKIVPVIASTNSELVSLGQNATIDGCVLTAELQTAGRGRRGRRWVGTFGRNIAVSIGMRLNCAPTSIGSVSLVVGLAVAKTIEKSIGAKAMVKWPNDVLISGRKVAGILIELTRAVRPVEIVVGIGMNVGEAPKIRSAHALPSASLQEFHPDVDRCRLLASLIDHVVEDCHEFEKAGFGAFQDSWDSRDAYRDKHVTVEGAGQLSGTARGVADDGALLIETTVGVERVIGGDVSLRDNMS